MEKENLKYVDLQIKAYNDKNLEKFLACYSDEIILWNIDCSENTIMCSGKKEMYTMYRKEFLNQYLECVIKNRMILGDTVVDYEEITYNEAGGTFCAIAIYQLDEAGLIKKVSFTKGKEWS